MSTSRDEERLLDALFEEAREAPGPDELRRLEQRLSPWLVPAGGPSRTAKAPTRKARALKPILVAVGIGLLFQQLRDISPRGADAPAETASIAVTSELPPTAREREPARLPVPEASVAVADLPSAPDESPGPSAPPPRPARAAPPPPTAETTVVAPSDVTESEATFLRRTRAALAEDPAVALRMTREHASRFPRGVLVQERDVIAIDALVRLGALDEARAKARAFRARYPRSAHASRIATILGTEGQ